MIGRFRRARDFYAEAEATADLTSDRDALSVARAAVIAMVPPGSGPLRNSSRADFVVAAALLVELAHEGRLGAAGHGKTSRVTVRDSTPVGDAELDEALLSIAGGVLGRKTYRLVSAMPRARSVVDRLVVDGLLTEQSHKRLGLVPVRRFHPTPAAGRDDVVDAVRTALLDGSVPSDRTALLISSLYAGGNLKSCVPSKRFKEARGRAARIVDDLGDSERSLLSAVDLAATNSVGDYGSGV